MTANTFTTLRPMIKETYPSKPIIKAPRSMKNTEKYGRLKKVLQIK